MFSRLFSRLEERASNDGLASPMESRRKDPRRENDRCVIDIDGQIFPVDNWSYGGILLHADERMFTEGENIDFTLKFKLSDAVMALDHHGFVLRKQPGKTVIKFDKPTPGLMRSFQQIVDDTAAQEFANSQAM